MCQEADTALVTIELICVSPSDWIIREKTIARSR